MNRHRRGRSSPPHLVSAFLIALPGVLVLFPVEPARGQDGLVPVQLRRVRPASEVDCACPEPAPLGTFEPTPYLTVRGNWPVGGGYSPLQTFGDQSMALYGPMSPLRPVAAPVTTYTRGYDGRIYANRAVSTSTPNLPGLTPVVYPTPASYYYGPRVNRTPPGWSSGMNWIDQN